MILFAASQAVGAGGLPLLAFLMTRRGAILSPAQRRLHCGLP